MESRTNSDVLLQIQVPRSVTALQVLSNGCAWFRRCHAVACSTLYVAGENGDSSCYFIW